MYIASPHKIMVYSHLLYDKHVKIDSVPNTMFVWMCKFVQQILVSLFPYK